MPNYATRRERELYMLGYMDGEERLEPMKFSINPETRALRKRRGRSVDDTNPFRPSNKPKRKLSAWNKFVKANSKKKIYRYANGKLKLKKMGIAFRKKRRR
tara:strand:+ start:468 stop:770 length:303 start_codon:yes stop_codon:yes gene_type:complete